MATTTTTAETPLIKLGEEISAEEVELMRQAAQRTLETSDLPKRARLWIQARPAQAIAIGFSLGVLLGAGLAFFTRSDE